MTCRRTAMCLATAIVAMGTSIAAQATPALSALTVPAASLPDGCQLASPPPTATPLVLRDDTLIVKSSSLRNFPANPWQGTDYQYIAKVQHAVEPPQAVKLPDGPPLDAKEANRLLWTLRGHVAEAYHAVYEATTGASIVVQAVRYHDAKWATPEPRSPNRIVRGSTVILVRATQPTGCLNAILSHIQALR